MADACRAAAQTSGLERPSVRPAKVQMNTRRVMTVRAPSAEADEAFFDRYSRFFETSRTAAVPARLNLRHKAIVGVNRDAFDGARVLDLASHDGRWSFAALKAGADKVIGVEARSDLLTHANSNFTHYGVDPARYQFIGGDLFTVLTAQHFEVDVVLCLGFVYHTLRYTELFHHIRATGARALIIDTEVARSNAPVIRVGTERVDRQGRAVPDDYSPDDRVLIGRPSLAALSRMLGAYGYAIEHLTDWATILRDSETETRTSQRYADGRRITARCQSTRM
jgi:Methyltransferase domain